MCILTHLLRMSLEARNGSESGMSGGLEPAAFVTSPVRQVTSPALTFLLCKMGIIVVNASRGVAQSGGE